MKRIIGLLVSALLVGGVNALAQGSMDAFKYSQSELHGTARYASMAGAFGALGGDISSMSTNPAGLGIYRSSEVVTTISLSTVKAKTNWTGIANEQDKSNLRFDNIAYIGYYPTGNDEGIKSWNFGIAYNRLKDFNRNYTARGAGLPYSLSSYIADIANMQGYTPGNLGSTDNYDPYYSCLPLPVVGYLGGHIAYSSKDQEFKTAFGDNIGDWAIESSNLKVIEKGAIDKYDFSFATNISDIVFLGATLAVSDIDYRYTSGYEEDFGQGDNLYLENRFSTEGSGFSVNVGAIARPVDFLRVGVAYNSPTWYKLKDYSYAYADSEVDGDFMKEDAGAAVYEYKLKTSDRWIFSLASIIGTQGLISVDYEINNYSNMRFSDLEGFKNDYESDNRYIKEDFRTAGTLRIGGELKITPQFAVRLGGAWADSPVKSAVKNGNIEIATAGTIPHYTVDKGTITYSAGLGYRFTPNFYADIACIYKERKEDVYAFSSTFLDNHDVFVESIPASMKTNTTRVALTLGYKF